MQAAAQAHTEKIIRDAAVHPVLRTSAKVVSFLFHPLFVPIYLIWFLLHHSALFPGFSPALKNQLLIRFFVLYTLFPAATVGMAKALGFVEHIQLKTQRDRIIPYVACGVYYFWMWYVLRNQPQFPPQLVAFALAVFLASSAGLLLNAYLKISMHALSAGVVLLFLCGVALQSPVPMGLPLSVAFVLAGLVCTARLVNSDHHPVQVYFGLAVGMLAQAVAFWVM